MGRRRGSRPGEPERRSESPRASLKDRGRHVMTNTVAFDMAAAPADNIEGMVKDYCAKEGGPSQAARALAATQVQGAQLGSHARANQQQWPMLSNTTHMNRGS